MIRRPPRSTRTYTLVPYTTLFRSPLVFAVQVVRRLVGPELELPVLGAGIGDVVLAEAVPVDAPGVQRSEEHTSELQSLMRISYAVFCLKKKKKYKTSMTDTTNKLQQQKHNTDSLIS